MKFKFIGNFSKGSDVEEQMKIVFVGREPTEVTDEAAIAWFAGHPEFVVVEDEEVIEEAPKKARKAKK